MSYDAKSIKIRDFRTACRATPGMYIGTDGQDAAFNCFLEVLNNACDEAIMGRGKEIRITLSNDLNTIIIADDGAGVPHGKNEDCEEVLVELFTTAHSSGKFDTKNYKKVRGLHGIGTSAVCVCSDLFQVTTKREGTIHFLSFIDGLPEKDRAEKIADCPLEETGSEFLFKPSKEIFHIPADTPSFDYEKIRQELELTSYFIPGITFVLTYNEKEEKFFSKNGLKDFARDKISNPLHKSYIYGYKEFDDEVEIEVFAQWTQGKEQRFIFSNGALNSDGGTPETGAKTAFTRTINSVSKGDFDADMIRKGLVYIVNIRHPKPIYQNQTKNKIQNPELRGYTQTVMGEAIKEFVVKHKGEFDQIVEILTKEKKAELAAQKARKQVLDATKDIEKNQKKKVFNSDKLKDAEFLGEESTLLIVEGDSAAASMAMAREIDKYGILAIRGKMLNCLSHTEEKIFENEEIKLLLSAMNIIPGKYDAKKMRYGKIGICVDGDSDGYHIGLLIMSALQYLCPQFLEEKRLHWLRTPLYIIKNGKKEEYFYSDEEFSHFKGKGEVNRAKGLGALSADQARNSMFGENQIMDCLEPDNDSLLLLTQLMGVNVEPRRDFVFNQIDFSEVKE